MNLRTRYDGLEKRRKNEGHSEGLDRTNSLHGRQTRTILYGAVHTKKLDAELSSTDNWYDIGRRRVKIR